jgi:PAS domain-containing protein
MSFAARIVDSDDHALLALVLDDTYDCIKLLDTEGRIEFVNRRGAEAMELRTPEELIGQLWLDRWPSEARQRVKEALGCARSG